MKVPEILGWCLEDVSAIRLYCGQDQREEVAAFFKKTFDELWAKAVEQIADGFNIDDPDDFVDMFPNCDAACTTEMEEMGVLVRLPSLPKSEEFDLFIDLALTTKQTNDVKKLAENRNQYRIFANSRDFDYLPAKNRKYDPTVFYKIPFRIVRFKIADGVYETVVTNLDMKKFPPEELKRLYNMRWGIETSFQELKYTVGLLHFHAKKWSTYTKKSLLG